MWGHDPRSKPEPWAWQWHETWAYYLGLPQPVAEWPFWEGAGYATREYAQGVLTPFTQGATPMYWGNGGLTVTSAASGGSQITANQILTGSQFGIQDTDPAISFRGRIFVPSYDPPGPNATQIIARGLDGAGSGWSMWLTYAHTATSNWRYQASVVCVGAGAAEYDAIYNTAVNPGFAPQDVGLVYQTNGGSSGSVQLWLNGIQVASTTFANWTLRSSTVGLTIGGGGVISGVSYSLEGALLSMQAFRVPLTAAHWQLLAALPYAYESRYSPAALGALKNAFAGSPIGSLIVRAARSNFGIIGGSFIRPGGRIL